MRVRAALARWRAIVLLALIWVLLWGNLTLGTVLAGLLVATAVVLVFPQPVVRRPTTVRPLPALLLVAHFVVNLVLASLRVAWVALRPGPPPRGGLVAVALRPAPELFFAMTAGLSTLLPGSVTVEADAERARVVLHVLDLTGSGGPDAVRRVEADLQERVLRAFASRDVLAQAGLA